LSGIKTFSNETSERYASALFELASENSEIEDVEKNIILLLKTLNNNVDFKNFLKNPTNKLEIQSKVFSEISKVMGLKKTLSNFLQLIINKRRIYFLDKILLRVLKNNSNEMGNIFFKVFNSKPKTAINFLSNKSSFFEDLEVILKMPKWKFLKELI